MLYEDVQKTVNKYNLISKEDSIVVGVSGGPDSVCLLHLLYRISKNISIKIYAVHLNHQIRGLDAYLDSLYVSKLCDDLDIPCFVKSIDVPKYCKDNKLGLEVGARKLRYEIFNEVRNSVSANKIAIGHNKNDQAETILMRIMRGTGLRGLKGIGYLRIDGVIRPILDIKREDIEKYCEENNLKPRIDRTNLEEVYSRNKIRLKILPYMKQEFNENIVDSIVRMSNSLRTDSDYIEHQVEKSYESVTKKYSDGVYIFTENLKNFHLAIKTRIVIKAIETILGNTISIDKKHIDEILELEAKEKKDKKINLPRGLFVYRFSDYILITNKEVSFENIEYEYELQPGVSIYIPEIGKTFKSEVISYKDFDKNNFEKNIQYIDLNKINGKLTLRNRRQGDKIRLLGGTKKIKDLFIGLKIPREERSFVPLITDKDQTVISVYGYRINIDYKVDNNTRKILKFMLE